MSQTILNRIITTVMARAKKDRSPPEPFTVHDLHRARLTLLSELAFDSD